MFKTASLSHPAARWLLWVLAVCLLLHFLVEDTALLSIWEAGAQAGIPVKTTNTGSDEMTHQDDLALPARLPERLACDTPSNAQTERLIFLQPALLPSRLPPKIS